MTKVFVASAMPTSFPRKLQKPSTIRSAVRDTADEFIMDSGIGDDVTNEEVLDLAREHNADWIVAKDYLHDQAKTSDSIKDFVAHYRNHPCEATPMIPLQPPFDEHFQEHPDYDHYVLGGMAMQEIDLQQKLEWIRDFRRIAPNVYAHGLGVGGGIEFVRRIAPEGLLDSIDCSTPEQAAQFGKVLNERLRQEQVRVINGEGASKRNHALAEFNSLQLQDVWDAEAEKDGLSEWCD